MRNTVLQTIVFTLLLCAVGIARGKAHDDTVIVQGAPAQPYASPYGPGYAPYAPPPVYVTPPVYVARERRAGSIFGYGYRGMFTGALAGLGVSYFVARESYDAYRDVGLCLGIGALAGAGAGLTLGLLDHVGVDSAYYISRDLPLGALFGAAVGALAGGVSALGNGEGGDVLFGAAAGSLAGLGFGAIAGVIEGQLRPDRGNAYVGKRPTVSFARTSDSPRAFGVQLAGTF